MQEAALAQEWEQRKVRKQVKMDAKGQISDAESRSLYVNWRRVLKPLKADEEATAAVRKRRDKSLLLALQNYRLCVVSPLLLTMPVLTRNFAGQPKLDSPCISDM